MDNFQYELSEHIPKQHKSKFYIITCVILFFCVLFMIWYHSFELRKIPVLFGIFFGFAGTFYNRKKKKYSQEQLFWKNKCLYYVVVLYDQYVNLNDTKYQRMEKKYHIRSIKKVRVYNSKVVIHGDILCTTTNDINTKISTRESHVSSIVIPNHFDNWEHFIQSLDLLKI